MVSLAHVPMALSTQGSTLMTVAQSIINASGPQGISSKAVLSDNRNVSLSGAELHYVDYTRNCPRAWFSRTELAIDIGSGRLGQLRPFHGRLYDPAIEAIRATGADVTLLYEGHYAAASLPRWNDLRRRSILVLYCHNPLSRSYGQRELRRLLARADVVAFCADHLRLNTEERLDGVLPARFVTVPNGVDPLFFPLSKVAASEPFTVVFAGLTSPHKGTHLVLEAIDLASHMTDRPLRGLIIGSHSYGHEQHTLSEYESRLRAKAEMMTAPVEFLPFLPKPELGERLRNATVACLPSQWPEGMPLIALEAMASGLPLITSDSIGMVEAVGDAGFIVPGGDPKGMAEVFVRLSESQAERTAAVQRSLARATKFTWERVAAVFASLTGSATA